MGAIEQQGIRDFYKQATTRGLARDFQFRVVTFKVNGIEIGPSDLVFLKTASLPGKSINTTAAPFMGLDFQIPGTVKFDGNAGWPVKFYCSQDYRLRTLLEVSVQDTFSERSSLGNMEPRDLDFNIIKLSLVDDIMREIKTYTLHGAFINKIDETGYDMTGSGKIQEVGASIAYQYWSTSPTSDVSYGRRAVEQGFGGGDGTTGGIGGAIADFAAEGVSNAIAKKLGNGSLGVRRTSIESGLASVAASKAISGLTKKLGFGG